MKQVHKESYVEALLRDGMKRIGGKAYKFESPGNAGVPDRIIIFPNGKIEFVELKSENGVVRPLQASKMRELESLHQTVRVVKGIDELADYFSDHGYGLVGDWIRGRKKV